MSPQEAYLYALKHGPSDETREIACQYPYYAYIYARYIDKKPKDGTRIAACKHPDAAYDYARDIDKEPHEETKQAAYKDPEYKKLYMELEKNFIKEQII